MDSLKISNIIIVSKELSSTSTYLLAHLLCSSQSVDIIALHIFCDFPSLIKISWSKIFVNAVCHTCECICLCLYTSCAHHRTSFTFTWMRFRQIGRNSPVYHEIVNVSDLRESWCHQRVCTTHTISLSLSFSPHRLPTFSRSVFYIHICFP